MCAIHHNELKLLVDYRLELDSRVVFVKSPDDCEKGNLFQASDGAVIYAPVNEHFGVVPL